MDLLIFFSNPLYPTNAIHIIEKNLDSLCWWGWQLLLSNPNAIPILEKHHILEKNLDIPNKTKWCILATNPNAIHIFEQNLVRLQVFDWYDRGCIWSKLSSNPNAIPLFEKHLDEVNWYVLSENPNAIHLLAHLDTEKMRENCRPFAEELASYVFRPARLMKICEQHNIDLEQYFELV